MQTLNFLKQERMRSLKNKKAGKIGKEGFCRGSNKELECTGRK